MLGHMRCRSNIHTFEDDDFLKRMTQCSAVTFIIGLAATLVFAVVLAVCVPGVSMACSWGYYPRTGEES